MVTLDPESGWIAIEEPQVIATILSHLQRTAPEQDQTALPLGARALPVPGAVAGVRTARRPRLRSA